MLLGPDLPPGVYVQLKVADSGRGMDLAQLRRIFDPFFTTKARGRGLGLAAVLGIARGHRAAICVTSQPDKGTHFCICFPAVVTPAVLPTVQHVRPGVVRSGVVLVVDDDAEVRQVAERMLQRLGYAVVSADSGQAGLDFFTAHRPQVLCTLLDLTMPMMSGQEVLRELRRIDPRARVIVMSGYTASEAYRQLAGEAHVEFLPKPFTIEQLREVLARCSEGMGRRGRQHADQTPPSVLSGAGISSNSTAGLPSQ
jgi:CheY-like chemotaxis protein